MADTATLERPEELETTGAVGSDAPAGDPWIGKFVIVRGSGAGVHAGVLKARAWDLRTVELTAARRLWRWRVKGNKGVTLSDVATLGLDSHDTKLGAPVDVILTGTHEIIECSPEAAENIAQFETHVPR